MNVSWDVSVLSLFFFAWIEPWNIDSILCKNKVYFVRNIFNFLILFWLFYTSFVTNKIKSTKASPFCIFKKHSIVVFMYEE